MSAASGKRLTKKADTQLHPNPGQAFLGMPTFSKAAKVALGDGQLRSNLAHVTTAIRTKRLNAVNEMPDWQELRRAGETIKDETLRHLDSYLDDFADNATKAGATVHWALDADEAVAIARRLVEKHQVDEVIKVKSMATQEIGLNEEFEKAGIHAWETDLAELIVQLGNDAPSHFLVPAIHRNRHEIRQIFLDRMGEVGKPAPADLAAEPAALAEAARQHLRQKFLHGKVAISGANFAIAETGTLVVVESEGNGRMCLTLPDVLISVVGIEKVLPTFADLDVFMQLLPRSSTAERMNPYTTMWTGVTPGDGPQEMHIILIDNGRTNALRDTVGRQALRCIRCSACLNVCPVYERVGGHAYGSVYPGPIGAILNPLLHGVADEHDAALPFASSLCGACFDACPVRIDIPSVLLDQRARVVEHHKEEPGLSIEALGMAGGTKVFENKGIYRVVQRAVNLSRPFASKIPLLPTKWGYGWTKHRALPPLPKESFRHWWKRTRHGKGAR